jgi:hypothetical protein
MIIIFVAPVHTHTSYSDSLVVIIMISELCNNEPLRKQVSKVFVNIHVDTIRKEREKLRKFFPSSTNRIPIDNDNDRIVKKKTIVTLLTKGKSKNSS